MGPNAEGDEARLWAALAAQVHAVDARVGSAPAYQHEAAEVRRAALEVPVLQRQLGLSRFVADLTPSTGKPQFLLEFAAGSHQGHDGTTCVLKVYGRRRPGEGALQTHWYQHGVPTPRVYHYADTPVSWLLLEHVAANAVRPASNDELLALTRQLAGTMSKAHAVGTVLNDGTRSLSAGIAPHLMAVVTALSKHGYEVPSNWRSAAAAVYSAGRRVSLHGDLFPGNLLATSRGVLLVDACGYVGDPSFDAARWAARVGSPDCPPERVLQAWLEVETDLDPRIARTMLAAETLMEAGVREIVKDEKGLPFNDIDADTVRLIDDCVRLWEVP